MTKITEKDFTGYSAASIDEAISNAIEKVGAHARFEVVETRSHQGEEGRAHYQVTITTFQE